jgi:hypothetical protein
VTLRFNRCALRTTDVEAARAFYRAIGVAPSDEIFVLPKRARDRGAKPHFLGFLDARPAGGVDAVRGRFLERGAEPLGEIVMGTAILRGPGGAVVGLTEQDHPPADGVVLHQLNARDAEAAAAAYAEVCGWSIGELEDFGPLGQHRRFSYEPSTPPIGLVSDVAGRPGVHTHWLFHCRVASVDATAARVRAHGGVVIGPFDLPDGGKVAACDDPQGAAFGLIEG